MIGYKERLQRNLEKQPLVKAIKESMAKLDKTNMIKEKKSEILEKKRAAYAPKRKRKLQLKLLEAINLDLEDKQALADIAQRALREGRVEE